MKTAPLLLLLLSPLSAAAQAPADPFAAKLVELRRELHRRPELGNREKETMRRIAAALSALGLSEVKTGVAKTGVVATIPGAKPGPAVGLRVPIDAFAIQESRATPYRSQTPGVSHACGHDALAAMAVGAAELLWARRGELNGSVRLLFQPAEEGLPEGEEGGAPVMVKEGAVAGLSAIIALHVDETIPAGQAGLHPGTVYAGSDTLTIKVEGQAAHGATPWKGVDAIAVAAQIVTALQQIPARQADVLAEPIVLTIGQISGGSRPNALAPLVELRGTLRSFSAAGRAKARARLSLLVAGVAEGLGASAKTAYSEETAPVVNDAALVAKLKPVLEQGVGPGNLRMMEPMSYADDFSYMSEQVPSFYFQLGVRNEARGITAGTHTEAFDIDESALPEGARLLARLAEAALK